LTLQNADGAFTPSNPIVDASLPVQLGSGLHVGGVDGIGIEPQGADPGVEAKRVGDSSLIYPNIDDNRDLIASAQPSGIELSTQIRSLDAPEAQSFHLDLPAGAELQANRTARSPSCAKASFSAGRPAPSD